MNDAFGSIGVLIGIVFGYLLFTLPIFVMAKKMEHEYAWLAFVPIANMWLLCDMAGKEWWWLLVALIPVVGYFIFWIVIGMGLAESFDQPSWLGILMILPIVNFIILYYFAFGARPAIRRY